MSNFSEHIMEAAESGVRSLRDYYDEGAPFEKITEFLGKLKDLPTDYFEAKIPRAVQLEEFSAAIIPSDLDPKLKKVLEERGLELREYDPQDKGDGGRQRKRKEALQKQTEEADLRFMPAPTFYSKAERAVEGAKGGVFDKKGMTTTDKAISLFVKEKKGDKQWQVPEAEVEWSGVVDWLEGRKEEGEASAKEAKAVVDKYERQAAGEDVGIDYVIRDDYLKAEKALIKAEEQAAGKVSKAELLEFLQNKGVKVEEVARGQIGADLEKLSSDSLPEAVNNIYEIYRADDPDGTLHGSIGQLTELDTKHPTLAKKRYGKDHPFVLNLSLKDNTLTFKTFEEANSYIQGVTSETLFRTDEYFTMLPGDEKAQQSYGELVLTLPEDRAKSSETFEYSGGHRFPESNILAHIRFTERVDADGKKMLFIEEMQSDWSNTGRRDGWKQERPAEVQKEIQRLKEEGRRVIQKTGAFNHPKYEAIETQIRNLEFENPINSGGAPDMPFKGDNRYGALAMKRMIRWASDNGFDRLGWITGKDTAERYNLSKVIDEIAVPSVDANSRSVRLDTGGGDSFKLMVDNEGKVDGVLKASQFTGKQLDEVIGKELAKKVMDFKAPGKLAGADLEVGGEWAKTLYDKVLPTQAKKIVKKKGAVGRTRLGSETAKDIFLEKIGYKERALKNEKKEVARLEREINDLVEAGVKISKKSNLGSALSDMKKMVRETEVELQELRDKQNNQEASEANYVDITPEVKALAEEGFSYFMPPGGGKGRAAAPAQPVTSLPATPIMPKVKLTDEEKEDSRRLLNLLEKKGI